MTDTDTTTPDPAASYRLLIGGEWVDGGDGTYAIVNPATEQVVGHAPDASAADAEAAAEAAAAAFPAWSRTTPEQRAGLLNRAADLLDERYAELVPLVQAETGATLRVTKKMQVPQAGARFRRYAQGIDEELEIPMRPGLMPTTALAPGGIIGGVARRAPVGVVACITSYNFPMTNMAGKLGPALAMGNTVVVKPAPQDPLAIVRLGEVFDEAGFPPGVVNIVVGAGSEAAEALVASPHVDMVSFTGSTGRRSAHRRGRRLRHEAPAARARRQGRRHRVRRRRPQDRHRRHRQRVGLPLRPDLHRPDAGARPARHLRPARRPG